MVKRYSPNLGWEWSWYKFFLESSLAVYIETLKLMPFDPVISLIGIFSNNKIAILCTEKVLASLFKTAEKVHFNTSVTEHYISIKSSIFKK